MLRRALAMTTATLLLVAVSAQAATPTSSAAADAGETLSYYTPPTGWTVSNFGVAVDTAGDVWFSAGGPTHVTAGTSRPTPSLVRLRPASAVPGTSAGMTPFATPDPATTSCCANQMRSVTFNKDDGLLYYVRNDGGYGALSPAATDPGASITSGSASSPVDLWDVAPAKGGGAWLTEKTTSNVAPSYYGARIAKTVAGGPLAEGPNIAVQNGATTIDSSRYDAKPSGITVDAQGRPWFVEEDPGLPGYRIATYGGGNSYSEYVVSPCESANPCSGSYTGRGLTDVAAGGDGALWFTNSANRKIGRFDPVAATFTQYALASISSALASASPSQITAAPDGSLWVAVTGNTNALVHLAPPTSTTPLTATTTALGSVAPLGVAVTATDVWFGTTTSGLGRLSTGGTATPPGGETPPGSAPTTPSPVTSAPVVVAPASVGQARLDPPQSRNGEINANQVCVGPPTARCSLVYLVREHEYVAGFPLLLADRATTPAERRAAKPRSKPKPRKLASKAVVLAGGQTTRVTLRLNGLGRRILAAKGKVKVDVVVSEKAADGRSRVLTTTTLTVKAPRRSR